MTWKIIVVLVSVLAFFGYLLAQVSSDARAMALGVIFGCVAPLATMLVIGLVHGDVQL